ncbi:type II toxin-antitoxin system PemK/MazF family toxin [Ornithinimicrobium cavernae]|uniref:type II toxin-antitoxin system PemK/MazF family toxin n=1 Tax=Ornithinimicrobium cavernae TaxID=2666047 RepID=UPI000D691896|nr:type II toxin-antitoxin system PemK/MazF family toxin [Ornithinimicrobium cavernae]
MPHNPRARGHEQRGRRLAVILRSEDLPLSTVLLAPTSTSVAPRVFRPEVGLAGRRTCVLVEQLRAVDVTRLGRRVDHLARADLDAVEDALDLVLALDLRR